ncbi:4-hydroxythreonine-4-phosphate dehydrogenase PdxA [Silvibacterium sp.]|uniref:4-hydroxythreonine-4-phosphate dehydrogenase PdxA n=1 Tax=Silvibacterium sp. TaxID=1964179 RepID=UPI0039E658BC
MKHISPSKIVITLGDPAGVGAEVTLKALSAPGLPRASFLVMGDRVAVAGAEAVTGIRMGDLPVEFIDCGMLAKDEPVEVGRLRADYGAAAMRYVREATLMCLRGEADAMVTAPLNKEAVALGGIGFSGHTEYIAELCGAKESCMMLTSERLSVVHVSTHVSLRRAVELSKERIVRTIELGYEAMRNMGTERPRIAVCGLNPHAGEHGMFGTEDEAYIAPAVAACRDRAIDCEGPVPADTIFYKAARGSHDLVVAMYHDQGHIPMKLLDFEATVNTSLGLPIIRTSVDHGTAFDIAGKNMASGANMMAAIRLAVTMAAHRTPAPARG